MSGAPVALVDFHTGEKSARLDAAQKEILAIGKERWVEKVEETRMIRKMAGLVALGMSLLTVFYARASRRTSPRVRVQPAPRRCAYWAASASAMTAREWRHL